MIVQLLLLNYLYWCVLIKFEEISLFYIFLACRFHFVLEIVKVIFNKNVYTYI